MILLYCTILLYDIISYYLILSYLILCYLVLCLRSYRTFSELKLNDTQTALLCRSCARAAAACAPVADRRRDHSAFCSQTRGTLYYASDDARCLNDAGTRQNSRPLHYVAETKATGNSLHGAAAGDTAPLRVCLTKAKQAIQYQRMAWP